MRRRMAVAGAIASLILADSGCAKKEWFRSGGNAEDVRRELAACELVAERGANPLMMTNGWFLLGEKIRHDNTVQSCMVAKGYAQVPTHHSTEGLDGNSRTLRIKSGFRDLAWGSNPSENMIATKTDDAYLHSLGINAFRREEDSLAIGYFSVQSISYFFSERGLCAVQVEFDTGIVAQLVASLVTTWGNPDTSSESPPAWRWTPQGANATVSGALVMSSSSTSLPSFLVIYSNEWIQRLLEDQEKRTREGL